MIKRCYRCYKDKEEAEFPLFKSKRKGVCTECYREHYGDPEEKAAKHSKKLTEANRRAIKSLKERKLKHVGELLQNAKCVDCGICDPVVMEFDHRDPAEKQENISRIMNTHYPMSRLLLELEKCDIVCANCHRHRTAKIFGSWRLSLLKEG